jgi:hypothetical protein
VGPILSVLLLLLVGMGCIVFGVYVLLGKGAALIATGIVCFIAAAITARGASIA